MTVGRKKTSQSNDAAPTLLGLPRALDRLKLELSPAPKFEIPQKKEYDGNRGLKKDDIPLLKKELPDFDPKDFLYFVLNEKKEVRERAANAVIRSDPDLLVAFQKSAASDLPTSSQRDDLPTVAPALWSERTTGRTVSPADFIRDQYAPWLGQGLTRGNLKVLDIHLYNAYVAQTRRNPDHALKELPYQERPKAMSPEDALERRRASQRQNYHLSKK